MSKATISRTVLRVIAIINRLLAPIGVVLVSRSELAAAEASTELPTAPPQAAIPTDARAYLVATNPRLTELRRRYAGHPATAASRWAPDFVGKHVEMSSFRGDNPYVWSSRDAYVNVNGRKLRFATRAINYVLSAYYVREHDQVGVLRNSTEDGLFGAPLYLVDDRFTVSRDLLDSTLELNFLERHLGLSTRPQLHVLDVGAGYGRLGHRLVETFPSARVSCTDAVAESTFLSEFYLRFRGVDDRALVIPLDELESLTPGEIDLAVAIHSWSECPSGTISWWLDLIRELQIPHVMVVPNDGELLLSLEPNGDQHDFAPLLAERGYLRVAFEPKYGSSSCQRLGAYPTHYHLFMREELVHAQR
jgi:Methyltransferase small domain